MTLRFALARAADGTLTIHDSAGRLVRRLAGGAFAAGAHEFTWDGRDDSGSPVAAGIYFSHLAAGDVHDTRKLVVMR
jgi:flagellar hook assembly protein FlgD